MPRNSRCLTNPYSLVCQVLARVWLLTDLLHFRIIGHLGSTDILVRPFFAGQDFYKFAANRTYSGSPTSNPAPLTGLHPCRPQSWSPQRPRVGRTIQKPLSARLWWKYWKAITIFCSLNNYFLWSLSCGAISLKYLLWYLARRSLRCSHDNYLSQKTIRAPSVFHTKIYSAAWK